MMRTSSLLLLALAAAALLLSASVEAHTFSSRFGGLKKGHSDGALQPERVLVESHAAVGVALTSADVGSACHALHGVNNFECTLEVIRQTLAAVANHAGSTLYAPQRTRVQQNQAAAALNQPHPHATTDLTVGELRAWMVTLEGTLRGQTPAQHVVAAILRNTHPAATSTLTYTYGTHSELVRVSGGLVRGLGTNAQADDWIKAIHLAQFNTVKPPRVEQGHIVAAQLGGSNTDYHNFFAQTGKSNRGDYYRAEGIAESLLKAAARAEGCVRLTISFNYNAGNYLIASGGTYLVEKNTNSACFAAPSALNVDNWIQATNQAWVNRPTTFTVTGLEYLDPNAAKTITVTPQFPAQVGGLVLTGTSSTGATHTFNWVAGNQAAQTWTYTAPIAHQEVTFTWAVTTGQILFDEPGDDTGVIVAPMAAIRISYLKAAAPVYVTGARLDVEPNRNKDYDVELVLPVGSAAWNEFTVNNRQLDVTVTPSAGQVNNGISHTVSFTNANLNQKLPFTVNTPATGGAFTLTYTLGSTAAAAFAGAVPAISNLVVPEFTITTATNLHNVARGSNVVFTVAPNAHGGGTRVNIVASAGGVSVASLQFTDAIARTFTFTAPNGATALTLTYSLSGGAAVPRFPTPAATTITVV